MNELKDELSAGEEDGGPSPSERLWHLYEKNKPYVWAVAITMFLAIYTGLLLFGKNSFEVLLKLDDEQNRLADEVETLKAGNAKLQKEYFELKQLQGKQP